MCYNGGMTNRKVENQNKEIGDLIQNYRKQLLDIPRTRQGFIDDRSEKYFDNKEWISEKTLLNYETGKNVPSIQNIKKLAVALEIDPLKLIEEILELL